MDQMVEVKVMGVYMHQESGMPPQHFVLFRDEQGRRIMIWMGQFEAWAISFALDGETPQRPFSHDVTLAMLDAAGASLEKVHITELRDETFYSVAYLRVGEELKEIDIRPSDSVALALRAEVPIFISEAIMHDYCLK